MRPLRGRSAARATAADLIDAAHTGSGGVLLIEGAAGIGKSRLLAEAARIAADSGVRVAEGAADELDQVTPWRPLLRALCDTTPPILDAKQIGAAATSPELRLPMIEQMRLDLESAASDTPVLICLDDLQWADPATVLALASLPEQLFSYPVAWILAQRPFPASQRLGALTDRLVTAGATRIHLGPLDEQAVLQMTADVLGAAPDGEAAALVARAEGNPFYVAELLRDAASDSQHTEPREVAAVHLRALDGATLRILKTGSVLGREFTVAELAAVCALPASRLLGPIEQALAAEVLVEEGDHLAFRHDLVREAVYADIPSTARKALHREAAEALRGTGATVVRVAGQFAAGAEPGDHEAVDALTQAAQELVSTSPLAAADLSLKALDVLPADDPRHPETVALAINLLAWANRQDEARTLGEGYLRAHKCPPALEALIQKGVRRAVVLNDLRSYPEPVPARLLEDPEIPSDVRATLYMLEAFRPLENADFETTDRELETAAALLTEASDENEAMGVNTLWATAADYQGRMIEAVRRAEHGLVPCSSTSLIQQALHASVRVQILRALGRIEQAKEETIAGYRAAESAGMPVSLCYLRLLAAAINYDQGKLENARAGAESAGEYAEQFGIWGYGNASWMIACEVAVRQGDLRAARRAAKRMNAHGDPNPISVYRYWPPARLLEAQGRDAEALAALEPAFERWREGFMAMSHFNPSRLPHIVALALRVGDGDRAGQVAAVAERYAALNPGVDLFEAFADHARALIDMDADRLQAAVESLYDGPWPLATAAAREDLAAMLPARAPEAARQLEQAYEVYSSAGAQRDANRVRSALRALGVHKRQSAAARPVRGWAALTPAELNVAQVVAKGRTNRDAAAELFISPDTVNTHLRHAFAKLGIRSRVELARLVLEREHAQSTR